MSLFGLPGSLRPFQPGKAVGMSGGHYHDEPVDWLIDTGADWSAVLPSLARNFTTHTPIHANSAPPSNPAFRLATGIDIELTVFRHGGQQKVLVFVPVIAIKVREWGQNLVGTPELASLGAEVRWRAATQTGELCV